MADTPLLICKGIVFCVLEDWGRFKFWIDGNYTLQDRYRTEMLKPFTYGSACELMEMMLPGEIVDNKWRGGFSVPLKVFFFFF